jgi:hypothetical protein
MSGSRFDSPAVFFVRPGENATTYSSTDIDLLSLELRNSINYDFAFGLGFELWLSKLKGNTMNAHVEIGYKQQLNTVANGENRFNIPEELSRLGYVDNDFRLGFLFCKMGFNITDFNVQRKR